MLVRYLKIVYSKQPAFVATLGSSTSEQPQANGKNLSETCSGQHKEPSPAKLQSESSPVNIVHLREHSPDPLTKGHHALKKEQGSWVRAFINSTEKEINTSHTQLERSLARDKVEQVHRRSTRLAFSTRQQRASA